MGKNKDDIIIELLNLGISFNQPNYQKLTLAPHMFIYIWDK